MQVDNNENLSTLARHITTMHTYRLTSTYHISSNISESRPLLHYHNCLASHKFFCKHLLQSQTAANASGDAAAAALGGTALALLAAGGVVLASFLVSGDDGGGGLCFIWGGGLCLSFRSI